MNYLKTCSTVAVGLGLSLFALVACSGEATESRLDGVISPSQDASVKDSVYDKVVVDPVTGEQTVIKDTIHQKIDSSRVIDPVTGDTITKIDTIYVPKDTTLVWVGNSSLVITEINPINLNWLDDTGSDPGWVEIYNAGDTPANLKGYSLIENLKSSRKWVFGDEIIAPKSFRTVFCDKKNIVESPADTELGKGRTHTNWKLEKDGGSVYLIDQYYGVRDSVNFPALNSGLSWGIVDGGVWKYFDKPTPERPNTEATAYDGMAPTFDFTGSKGGFYTGSVTMNPPSVDGSVKIRCTEDGSAPTANSPEFNTAKTFNKNTVLRCAVYKEGLLTKDIVTNTYFIDETVDMPVVAVTVDPQFFQKHYVKTHASSPKEADPGETGLYADVEFPAHVEYFENGSKTKDKTWEIDAGISLMGGYSRLEDKKSVAIAMREEYQDGRLNYPLFETRKESASKFRGFNLRNNGNRFVSDYIEDAMGGAILEGSGVDYQRSRQVVVFYNGQYYGIHDMRERYNRHYVETNYGIDANSVVMVKHLGASIEASDNVGGEYKALLAFVAANDFSGENNANYAAVKGLMDVGNFADYMIAEMYAHNGDWPNNNVRAWRTPEQPWKFMVYDLDHGFDWMWNVATFGQSTNIFKWVKQGGRAEGSNKCYNNASADCFHTLYAKLIKNPEFQRLYVNHAAVMLQNYLNAERVSATVDKMAATLVASETSRDMEKYNRSDRYYSNSCGNGFSISGSCLKEWAGDRDRIFREEIQSEFGVSGQVSMTIGYTGNGSVLMDGMRLPGNGSYQGKFFGGGLMELTAVPAAGSVFTGWSDGATENPHLVAIADGVAISASFK